MNSYLQEAQAYLRRAMQADHPNTQIQIPAPHLVALQWVITYLKEKEQEKPQEVGREPQVTTEHHTKVSHLAAELVHLRAASGMEGTMGMIPPLRRLLGILTREELLHVGQCLPCADLVGALESNLSMLAQGVETHETVPSLTSTSVNQDTNKFVGSPPVDVTSQSRWHLKWHDNWGPAKDRCYGAWYGEEGKREKGHHIMFSVDTDFEMAQYHVDFMNGLLNNG